MRRLLGISLSLLLVGGMMACGETPTSTSIPSTDARPSGHGGPGGSGGPPASADGPFTFEGGPVFDIETVPNGNVLVPETVLGGQDTGPTTVWEIRTQGPGGKRALVEFTTPGGITPINGLATVGRGSSYAARGGLDLGENAALLHVTPDGAEVAADIEAFEKANDPDKFAIDDWKDPGCAPASGPFTPGPQSNPYHLAATSGNTFLVADAAGNTLLRAKRSGEIETVALFTPPTKADVDDAASDEPEDWRSFPFPGAEDGSCYVQPVPDAVATGPDGDIYVGELTGVGATGVSRVWRLEPGARGVTCPSNSCEVVAGGFTSILDIAFGPDGHLYVVEFDEAGWLTSVGVGTPAGGTVNRCDVGSGSCQVAEIGDEELSGLVFPGAITFDRSGTAWLLENTLGLPDAFTGLGAPEVTTVRKLGTP